MSNFGAKTHNSLIKKNLDEAILQFESAKSQLSLDAIYEWDNHSDRSSRPWLQIRASRVASRSFLSPANLVRC